MADKKLILLDRNTTGISDPFLLPEKSQLTVVVFGLPKEARVEFDVVNMFDADSIACNTGCGFQPFIGAGVRSFTPLRVDGHTIKLDENQTVLVLDFPTTFFLQARLENTTDTDNLLVVASISEVFSNTSDKLRGIRG